jgi:hypothetical protein
MPPKARAKAHQKEQGDTQRRASHAAQRRLPGAMFLRAGRGQQHKASRDQPG